MSASQENSDQPAADAESARGRRSKALGWALGGFVLLVFVITLARLDSSDAKARAWPQAERTS